MIKKRRRKRKRTPPRTRRARTTLALEKDPKHARNAVCTTALYEGDRSGAGVRFFTPVPTKVR
jgi:hypothetical protein